MTEVLYNPKIKPEHLARKAIVYLRQSSERQVRQNKESQQLQYAVAERVRALGWKQVEIINNDLGSSAGIASVQREGFEATVLLSRSIVCAILREPRPPGQAGERGAVVSFNELVGAGEDRVQGRRSDLRRRPVIDAASRAAHQ